MVQFRDLEMTQFCLLRRILGVCKRDFTSNEMILKAASSCGVTILPLEVVIRKRQLTYFEKRRRGGQEQSFRRSIMSDLDCFNIAYRTAEEYY